MSKVSIVVPVYNVEQYLEPCFESIRCQSYEDFEVVIVDDGSVDSSSVICERYSQKDNRFKFYKKDNGGLSSARNYGIKKSIGEYIIFLDSDDYWISEDFMLTFVSLAKVHDADIVRGEYIEVDEKGTKFLKQDSIDKQKEKLSGKVLDNYEFLNGVIRNHNFVWLNLYKRCIFDEVLFNEDQKFQEDIDFNIRFFSRPRRCVYSPNIFYAYRKRPNSLMTTVNIKNLEYSFHLASVYNEYVNKVCDRRIRELYQYNSIMMYYYTLQTIAEDNYYCIKAEIIKNCSLDSLRLQVLIWIKNYHGRLPIGIRLPVKLNIFYLRMRLLIIRTIRRFL